MLILVGVSIQMLIQSGLFKSAKIAATKTDEEYKNEANLGNEIVIDGKEYNSMEEYIKQTNCTHEWSEWEITKEATEEEKGSKRRTCSKCGATEDIEIPVKIVIGAYIEGYDPSIAENGGTINTSYTSTSSANGYGDNTFTVESITKWRILGEEEGQIIITPATPLKVSEYYLMGNAGYANIIDELNKISGIYGQGKYADTSKYSYNLEGTTIASGGRSIKLEDIGGTVNATPSTKTYTKNSETGYIDTDGVAGSKYTTFKYWGEDAIPSQGAEWKTLESGESVTIGSYGYSTGTRTSLQTEMIFKDETGTNTNYWLASRCPRLDSGCVEYKARFVYGGDIYELLFNYPSAATYNRGVRPAVYLKSDIQLEYNQETGTYTIM